MFLEHCTACIALPKYPALFSIAHARSMLHYTLQAAEHIRSEGLKLCYRRVPLSRNRTPVAIDVQELHNAFLCAGDDLANSKFLVLSRSASTSTSSSFVAHFLAMCINAQEEHSAGVRQSMGALPHDMASLALASSPGVLTVLIPERRLGEPALQADGSRSPDALMRSGRPQNGQSPLLRPPRRGASVGAAPQRLANSTISNLCRCVFLLAMLPSLRYMCTLQHVMHCNAVSH
jgi:hypothetical protein